MIILKDDCLRLLKGCSWALRQKKLLTHSKLEA